MSTSSTPAGSLHHRQPRRGKVAHPTRWITAITGIAAIGGFLFGYDTGVISGALLYIPDSFKLTGFTQGAIVSGLLLGAALGAIAAGAIADRLGRKLAIISAAVLFILGILIAITAPDVEVLVAGRFIIGLGVGAASDTVPLYIGEIAPPKARGKLVSMSQLMVTSGILVAYLVDYALSSSRSWEWMLGIGIIPALILGVGMTFMPQSPRWLIEQGRRDDARDVLEKIGQGDVLEQEMAAAKSESEQRNWRALLDGKVRLVLIVGLALAVIQQVTGINTVIYYAPTILKSTGLGSGNAILAAVPVGVINVVVTVVSLFVIDRIGRRPLLLGSLVGMVLTIAGLGLSFQLHAAGTVSVVLLVLYVASFAIGLGPVFWLLIAEIYPQRIRGSAMSLAAAANWLANFAVAQTFPLLTGSIGKPGTFWIFGGFGVVGIAFCLNFIPETKGRSLDEIEAELVGS